MASRTLRCYAEGPDGEWEAICLDLDIAVQGSSSEEVFNWLQEAISLYLESVTDLPPQERQLLLHRPGPVRFNFLAHALRGRFADIMATDNAISSQCPSPIEALILECTFEQS